MNKLFWYIYRLRRISLAELFYRLILAVRKRKDRLYQRPIKENYVSLDLNVKKVNISEFPIVFPEKMQTMTQMIDAVVDHKFTVFGIEKDFGRSIDWHLDPKSGNSWPLRFWGDINYRDGRSIGGIKFAWELNRLHHLPQLAIAYELTREERYKEEIFLQLESWLEANPYPRGIHWIMGIELGIRLVNLVYTLRFLGEDELTTDQKRLMYKFVSIHGHHLYRYPSKFTSGGNHAIAEALGLFVAGLCFPAIKNASQWKTYGRDVLEREVFRQIYPDGSSFEHSIPYLQFVLDHFLVYVKFCKDYAIPIPSEIGDRLKSSLDFISHILDEEGNYPHIGDDDDGYLMKLWFGRHNNFVSLLNSGAIFYLNSEWIPDEANYDEKTFFLFGMESKLIWDEFIKKKTHIPQGSRYFDNAGLVVIRGRTEPKVSIVGNIGPLGLKPLSGHGHADALSFWLSVDGQPIFIDPGTYLYHSGGRWRDYFRSASAHNTLRIDGLDQAKIVADFIFSDFYNISNILFEKRNGGVHWAASHDGYARLKDPVVHQREITFIRDQRELVIKDHLTCQDHHFVECFFHLDPRCSVTQKEDKFIIEAGSTRVELRVDDNWNFKAIVKGEVDPFCGWFSPSFNHVQKTNTIRLSTDIVGNESFQAFIRIFHPNPTRGTDP